MAKADEGLQIRRALFSASDKTGIVELAHAMATTGTELVATGKTATVLREAGLTVVPIEKVSGSPEAFQGRMKTLSFPVLSGILYRRGDASDEADLKRLAFLPVDCVVVNFYPFEAAAQKKNITHRELIEEIDIGGPTMVRAAAKNSPDVLVLTDPCQYKRVIEELTSARRVTHATAAACAATAWERIKAYDSAIVQKLAGGAGSTRRDLRYGENPHQGGHLEFDPEGPIAWNEKLTATELSYNNILDLASAYGLASDLVALDPQSASVVIVKHNNPCGVASVPKSLGNAQMMALLRAWEGDPVSAFGGVLVFSDPLEMDVAAWLAERFIELVAAPGLSSQGHAGSALQSMLGKRKNLKAVAIRSFGKVPSESVVVVPGGKLFQTSDTQVGEPLKCVTRQAWPRDKEKLAQFGISVCRALKSNALAIVREVPGVSGAWQLAGAGQGQPNRVEALERLAAPRAQRVLQSSAGRIEDCVMVSDAFFPFRDTVDTAHAAGIKYLIQPGGSIKDAESIAACDEHGMTMAFTGIRHFRH